MRIIIDGRMFQESGIGRYIRNLLGHLQIIDKRNEYFILHLKPDFDKLNYQNNFHKVLADFRWYSISEQIKLPELIESLKPDLVHFPHFNVPIFYKGKFVVTIHDLIHQHFIMQRSTTHGPLIYKFKQLGYRKVFREALKRSVKIIVPSNFVKKQLIENWEADKIKIVVTREAVDGKLFNIKNDLRKKEIREVMKKFDIKDSYLFYVGNAHPHKNVEGLIKTFLNIKKNYSDLNLVLAGHDHYFWQRIRKEFQDQNITYTGFISDKELVALYQNARCFILPSFEEGFGIPLLEAFACSCPVVSSNAGSLTEVGGNACLYFDPRDPSDMEEKILLLLFDEKLRKQLREKGSKRCKEFSWQKLAEDTLEVYKQCG